MEPTSPLSTRYDAFRRGGRLLGRLAAAVQLGFLLLGLYLFLDQSRDLISDAQFTWGERRVMAIVAVITLGGSALAGWILAQVLRISAEVIDLMADGAESAARTNELIRQDLLPRLDHLATVLEQISSGGGQHARPGSSEGGASALKSELASARSAGRIARVFELRDALTRHLRGEPLRELDRDLAIWLGKLVQRRIAEDSVDAEVAGWVDRALDSLGDMPEAEPLRQSLPGLRRAAGLCAYCGGPAPLGDKSSALVCPECKLKLEKKTGQKKSGARSTAHRETP